MVRMKVAKSELMRVTPILPKIAVSAAKKADPSAKNCQEEKKVFMRTPSAKGRCPLL